MESLQEEIFPCRRVILSPALCLLHRLLVQNQHVGEKYSELISNGSARHFQPRHAAEQWPFTVMLP